MLESLRARLLLWYTLILSVLIIGYAGAVTYLYWQSLLRDVDATLATTAATIARSVSADVSGTFDLELPTQFRDTEFGKASGGLYYRVWNANGDLVDRSDANGPTDPAPPPGIATRSWRRELVVEVPGLAVILVGRPLNGVFADVRSLAITVTGVGGLILLLSLAGGSFLAGRALAPIARISRTAGAMVGGDLQARIPVADTDSELEQVAAALNQAFDRMQLAVDAQRQFAGDASHELRTPLATLRAEVEWALKRPRSDAEYRGTIEKARQAAERLTAIADRLLTLARAETSALVERHPVDLTALIEETVAQLQPLAESQGVTVESDLQAAQTTGDRRLLAEAFSNLVKNAIEYNRPGGSVTVRMALENGAVLVTIRDTGIGIAAEDLPRIFERFYRADRSRSRHSGGAGLGLAIVKKALDEHGGTITCTSTPGEGTAFTVRLPLAATLTPRAAATA